MSGGSPRLRARALADVYYKEILEELEKEIAQLREEKSNLLEIIKKKDEDVLKFKREYEIKLDECERIAVTLKNVRNEHDRSVESKDGIIAELKKQIKEPEGGQVQEDKPKKKKKD